jgi:glycosyltransferase involved in cell wall biosynthesis
MKPHLFEAMRGYPTILLMQAQECLCPLNNLRLLGIGPVKAEQCPRNQFATPIVCHQCLSERGQHSGALHQVERALAGVGSSEYDAMMRSAFADAEAVLVLNPITAAMLEPFARRVCVVPWGIDPARFHWADVSGQWSVVRGSEEGNASDACVAPQRARTSDGGESASAADAGAARQEPRTPGDDVRSNRAATLFMAAVAGEVIKGFHVAHEACRILRQTRSDFELLVTFDPPGQLDEFTRSVGWCSQSELPSQYRAADICLVPTIAQDALSITSVEAMAAGRPVVASRIGGLPYTVSDGLTGLLFEPGNPWDLAEKITRLLDDAALRRQMGLAGRRRFEQDFMWPEVIKRYWRPLLGERVRG